MIVFTGKGVFGGIAIGRVAVYGKKEQQVKRQRVEDAEAQVSRFEQAKAQASEQLGVLYENLPWQLLRTISPRCLPPWTTPI